VYEQMKGAIEQFCSTSLIRSDWSIPSHLYMLARWARARPS